MTTACVSAPESARSAPLRRSSLDLCKELDAISNTVLDSAAMQPPVPPSSGKSCGQDAYSRSLARLFKLDSVPTLATTTLKTSQMTAARLTSVAGGIGMSSPMPFENAYIVVLALQEAIGSELWKRGRPFVRGPFPAGAVFILHLAEEPAAYLPEVFDLLLFHVPWIICDELAERHGVPRVRGFADPAGAVDPVLLHLGRALLPAMATPDPASGLFFDHVAFAMHARVATRYGQGEPASGVIAGGLTARQERIAKEMLVADLANTATVAEVARACHLSVSGFARAFRQAVGAPPHKWLGSYRIERAKDLLLGSTLSLVQIAYDCGFADQSHFTRRFADAVGMPPGAWRRARRL